MSGILLPGDGAKQEGISRARLEEIVVMYDRARDRCGVTVRGGKFVCQLPAQYRKDRVGVLPQDGRLIVTHPGLPKLIADPMTGTVRTA